MTVKLLTEQLLESLSLKEGYIGSSESTLVKMPHCLKSHVAAQVMIFVIPLGPGSSKPYMDTKFGIEVLQTLAHLRSLTRDTFTLPR